MTAMIYASLLINICVLVPVCLGLVSGQDWADAAYGPAAPARSILLSLYLTILLVSVLFLIWQNPAAVATLLLMQIVYKLLTPYFVGSASHPVVVSNLGIAAFHIVTLIIIWRSAFQ